MSQTDFKFIVTEYAFSQLTEAIVFYNRRVKGLGFELEEEIMAILELIECNPLLFPAKFKHFHEALVKRFPYIIVYEIFEKQIIVLNIFHTKQSPRKKYQKKL